MTASGSALQYIAAWLFPFLAVVAGVLLVRAWGLPGSGLVVGAQMILAAVAPALWLALVWAELGHFSLVWLDLSLLVACVGAWAMSRASGRSPLPLPRPRFAVEGVALAVVLLTAAVLFGHPAEQIVGGSDPGVYVTTGISIARTGRIPITDETLAAVPPELARDMLYKGSSGARYREGHYLAGYYLVDAAEGKMLPQFLHLFQTAIASLYQMGGIRFALFATPLFGCLSILMLYLLGRQLISPAAGLLAAALLTLNISQLWFARVPFADVALQFWLLAGLWALALLIEHRERASRHLNLIAILGGACFGLAHLTKLDSYVVPVIVLGYAGLAWLMGGFRGPQALLLGCYLLLSGQAALHAYLFSLPYVADVFFRFRDYVRVARIGTIIALPLVILVALFRARIAAALSASLPRLAALQKPFVVIFLLLCVYAYFVRPLRADLGSMTEDEIAGRGTVMAYLSKFATEPKMIVYPNRQLRTYVEEGMLRMSWYLTPLGVWLGIAGFLAWTTSGPRPRALPFLGAAFANSALVFVRGAVRPDFFWALKRYVPLVVPSFALLVAYTLWQLWTAQPRKPSKVVASVLACYLFTSYLWGSLPFWKHVEYEGAVAAVTALDGKFPDDAVVLFEKEQTNSASRIGTPLRFAFGKTVFRVGRSQIDTAPMREIVSGWLDADRPVYWLTARGTEIEEYGPVTWLGEQAITWPRHKTELEKLPEDFRIFEAHVQIYQIKGAEYRIPAGLNVNFGDRIVLLGYQLDRKAAAAGEALHLELYWYAQRELSTDYTVYSHLLDDSMTLWGQKDSHPVDGSRPTSGWARGEIVHDALEIPISPDAPTGAYQLSVGLYEWTSMTRLPILTADGVPVSDRLVLAQIQVEGAD